MVSDLNEIAIFARVVHAGSFTAAARELGLPKSTVSRKVSSLEERLGVRLLQRTTRKLSLTDVGRTYHDKVSRLIGELDQCDRAVSALDEVPRGLLRVTTPLNFDFLGAVLADFLRKYPEVRLHLVATDRVVDLIDEGFDVGVRAGPLADSSLVARYLAELRRIAVAAPGYLKARGTPKTPAELAGHDGLAFGASADRAHWKLVGPDGAVEVDLEARFVVNDVDLLHDAALAGRGIALLPTFRCVDDLRARRLVHVLPALAAPAVPIHALYPSARYLSAKVRAFVDHLSRELSPPPWERGPKTGA